MVDTVRGVLRVRKWPKKRGTPKSELQRYWIDWFKQANLLAKYADGMAQARAIAMTKGSGLYPRDIMLKAMRGRLYIWADENGNKYYPMAGIQDISDSLDVLAQQVGSVLVRATDRWRSAVPGNIGDVLTYQGPAAAPDWQAAAAAASGLGALVSLSSNPSIPNNTFTPIIWGNKSYDTANYVDIAANPTRFTAPVGATYARVTANLSWASNGTGTRILRVTKNGGGTWGGGWVRDPNSDGLVSQNLATARMPWEEGDYLEVEGYQGSGGNLSMESTANAITWACLESW